MIRVISFASFLILTIFIFVSEAKAQTYSNGYFDKVDNKIFYNNYWFDHHDTGYLYPYYRTKYQYPGYYYNGCWNPGNYYFTYTRYYVAPTPSYVQPATTTYPTVKDTDWRTQLLKVAEQRDKYNGQIQKEALEHAQYMEAVKALGLPQPIPSSYVQPGYYGSGFGGGYGYGGYAIQGNYSSYPIFGTNASTIYGYNSVAALYKDTDINQLYLQAAQLTAGAQKLAGDANTQFGSLVSQEGNNRARIADILAKGAFIQQVMQTLQAPAPMEVKNLTFSIQPGGKLVKDDSKVTSSDKDKLAQLWGDSASTYCSNCHYGTTKKAGWSIEDYPNMSQDDKQKRVWPRLVTQDEKLRMPRNADGSAAPALSNTEIQKWLMY